MVWKEWGGALLAPWAASGDLVGVPRRDLLAGETAKGREGALGPLDNGLHGFAKAGRGLEWGEGRRRGRLRL